MTWRHFKEVKVTLISKNRKTNNSLKTTPPTRLVSSLEDMESFVKDLREQVRCSLCDDTLIEPRIVSCYHTFCKACVKRHAKQVNQINIFKCPRCKSQTPLPELNSVEDLQPSLLHSRILKGLALVEGEKVCSVSESHSSASWYCFDCDRSMCDECEKSHSVFTKDHKAVRLTEMKKEDIEYLMTRENPCTSHPQHRLEFFCQDCDAMICKTCLIQDHRNHKTMPLDKFASIKKAELLELVRVLGKLRFDNKEKQEQEKIANAIIKQHMKEAKREVKDRTKKVMEMLQENERELLRQIDEKLDTATTNLNIIHHIPAVLEYIKNVIERGLASEMMNNIQEKKRVVFSPFPPYSRTEFIPNQDLLRQVSTGLGELQTRLIADPTKCTIQMSSETEALKKEKLVLLTKTTTGENLKHDPKDVIDVRIKPEENVKVEEKVVGTDGNVEVEFVAQVPGQLTAEVQVNGNHISNSPLMMNVKPQEMKLTGQFNIKGVNITSYLGGISVNRDNSAIAVVDSSSQCIRVFTSDGQLSLTYGSQGSGQGQLNCPQGVAFLNDTDLVIADCFNHRMCIMNTTTGSLIKSFGNQGNGDGEFSYPSGVHVDEDGNIIVCDGRNGRVQVFTRDGDYQYQFGLTTQDKLNPSDVIAHDGLFYISDYNNVIHVFKKRRNVPTRISTIGGEGSADGQLRAPRSLAINNDHHLLVCDEGNNRVQKFSLDGRFVGKTDRMDNRPRYITVLKDGQLLVTCANDGIFYVM